MVLVIVGVGIIAFLSGCAWEQLRWVKLQKTNKIKEVDGILYKVIKIDAVGYSHDEDKS